jgi:hypothetical protein
MHRLRRKTVLAWMSGVLCALGVVFWIRGFWIVEAVDLFTPYHVTSLITAEGGFYVHRLLLYYEEPDWMAQRGIPAPQPSSSWTCQYVRDDADDAVEDVGPANIAGRWGFWFVNDWNAARWNTESPPYPDDGWALRIPWWSIVLITGVLPTIGLVQWVRRERPRRQGICPECGYDLRATPRRCPECGYAPQTVRKSPLNL